MSILTVKALYHASLSGVSPGLTRCSSDYSDELDSITAGLARYQVRSSYLGQKIASNTSRDVYEVEIVVAHRLAAALNERAWTEDASTGMDALQRLIGSRAFWVQTGVYGFEDGSALAVELDQAERIGNVVRFAARANIVLT